MPNFYSVTNFTCTFFSCPFLTSILCSYQPRSCLFYLLLFCTTYSNVVSMLVFFSSFSFFIQKLLISYLVTEKLAYVLICYNKQTLAFHLIQKKNVVFISVFVTLAFVCSFFTNTLSYTISVNTSTHIHIHIISFIRTTS